MAGRLKISKVLKSVFCLFQLFSLPLGHIFCSSRHFRENKSWDMLQGWARVCFPTRVWTTRTTRDVQGFLPCLQTRGGSSDWDRSGVVTPCRQHCRAVCVRPHKRVQTSQNMKCKRDPAGSSIGGPTRWRRTLVAGIRRGPIGFYRCSCEEQATVQHCMSCFAFKPWQVWDFQFRQTEKNKIKQNHFVKRKMYQVENEWFILLKISDLLIY